MEDGNVNPLWGASPAIDVQDLQEKTELHCLLVHNGDIRHLIKTVAQRHRHLDGDAELHFYLMETSMEVQARNLLLLSVLLDYELPIRQRAGLFLEIFGNSFVQSRTSRRIADMAIALEKLLCDGDGYLKDLVDFGNLKFKDRDVMQEAFQAWGQRVPCDMENFLDRRRRHHFKERYDARKNLVDWDYCARVKPINSIIHHLQYRDWRLKGIAFEYGDCEYDAPNKTMATYIPGIMKKGRDRGLKKDLKGYWSDTLSSPFLSFGTDIDTNSGAKEREEQLFDIFNKNSGAAQHRHNAGEIATVNIISFLYELETLQEYALQRDRDIFSGLGNEDARPKSDVQNSSDPAPSSNQSKSGEETDRLEQNNDAEAKGDDIEEHNISNGEDGAEVEDGDTANDSAEKAEQRKQKLLENLGNVRIHFLGADMASLLRKRKFQSLFDVIIFGTAGLSQLVKSSTSDENAPVQPETTEAFVRSDDLMKISKPDAKILFENGRNLAFLSGKQVLAYGERLDALAESQGLRKEPWRDLASNRPQQEPEPGAQQIDECCGPKGLSVYSF